jgi:hypothetical protein
MGAMRPPQPYATDFSLGSRQQADSDLEVWRECVPDLAAFTSVDQIIGRLRAAASSRRPDPVLSIVCELSVTDERSMLPELLLAEGFASELGRLTAGMDLLGQSDPHHCFEVADVLAVVIGESVLLGEQQCGKVLMSRTWARSFERAGHGTAATLLAEAAALCARFALAVRDQLALVRSRGVRDRIAGRLSAPREASLIRDDAGATGADVGDLAAERGFSPLVIRRQVRELDRIPSSQARRRSFLAATLWSVHDFAERADDLWERDEDEDEEREDGLDEAGAGTEGDGGRL